MNKYRNKKTVYNGVTYDSALEAKIAQDIDIMLAAGIVSRVARQVSYELRGLNGSVVTHHVVDFVLEFSDLHTEVWEAKGMPTRDFEIKLKLFRDNYPEITYVIHSKNKKYTGRGI